MTIEQIRAEIERVRIVRQQKYNDYAAKRDTEEWEGYDTEEAEDDGKDQGFISALESVILLIDGERPLPNE